MSNIQSQDSKPSSVISCQSSGKLYRMINFALKHGNCGGSLVQFQQDEGSENTLPFSIGKVLVSSDMKSDDVRGNHAHHETEEIVVALSGGCTFELDDGKGTRERVRLGVEECEGVGESDGPAPIPSDPTSDLRSPVSNPKPPTSDIKPALLLYPHVWRTFYDFEPGTVLLVVANIKYDEVDYIRSREEFERLAQSWDSLGGSAN